MLGSLNNILVYQAGGRLVLDEPFRGQPSAATVTLETLDGQPLTELGSGFAAIANVPAAFSTLSLTLPGTTLRQRNIAPSATAGYVAGVDDLTDPGYALLVNRGGRLEHVCASEYTVSGSNITALRFDDGLDYALTAGDTAKGVRVQYDVDWSSVTAKFVGQIQATWKITVNGRVHVVKRIYDVVRQVLHCPAKWADVRNLRADVDQQTSNIQNKEAHVLTAWENVQEELRNRDAYHNLIVPHGSYALRDAVVYRCLINLAAHQSLNVPPDYVGGLAEYVDWLEDQKGRALGPLTIFLDKNEDGKLSENELVGARGPIMLRGKRRPPPQTRKVSP